MPPEATTALARTPRAGISRAEDGRWPVRNPYKNPGEAYETPTKMRVGRTKPLSKCGVDAYALTRHAGPKHPPRPAPGPHLGDHRVRDLGARQHQHSRTCPRDHRRVAERPQLVDDTHRLGIDHPPLLLV